MAAASKTLLGGLIVAITIPVFAAGQEASAAREPGSDLAEARTVLERLFGAIEQKDLEQVKELWSERSPNRAAFLQTLRIQLAVEDLSYRALRISRSKSERDKSALRAAFIETALHSTTQQKREASLARNVVLIREAGAWKLWRFSAAVNDLADALVGATTEEQSTSLLSTETDLETPELVQALADIGESLFRKEITSRRSKCVRWPATSARGSTTT